jgi:type II secretion system protein D
MESTPMLSSKPLKVNAVSVNAPARTRLAISLLCSVMIAHSSMAQNGRPDPERPANQNTPAADRGPATDLPAQTIPSATTATKPNQRRPIREGSVVLAFNETPLEEIIPFIVEATGKVVMPINLAALKVKKITVINDEPVDRAAALDLIISALQLNGVGVIETDEVVVLDLIENIRVKSTLPVLGPNDDVMMRDDIGQFIVKIYRLSKTSAENVHEKLQDNLPDYATLNFDANSNQIILYGTVGLAQHYQRIIDNLDQSAIVVETKTFVLLYDDAQSIADQIVELFEPSGETQGAAGGAGRQRQPQQNRRQQPGGGGAGGNAATATPAGTLAPGPVVELRVSVNVSQNAVTVTADPATIRSVADLVNNYWDLPRPPETAKVYVLRHTDPLKVRDLLLNILGQGGGNRAGTRAAGGAAGRGQQAGAGGAGGGASSVTEAIGDIYRIEAYPDQSKILVLGKTKDALNWLDSVIEEIDQPSSVGLPEFVELKHASAVGLAKELNVLLAEAGTGGDLETPDEGLTGQGFDMTSGDESGTTDSASRGGSGGTGGGSGSGTMEFPWQRGRPRDDQSEPSPLIGKVRIVPIVRQNALSVLAPTEYREAIIELIHRLDKPGRQVMISAVIAQVELTDDLALGLRFSNQEIVTSSSDNVLSASGAIEGSKEDILGSLFDTSVLDVNADINVLLQALNQKTNVRILQEPRVFTADNQEAIFFNGQQIPILDSQNTSDVGGFQQNFDQQDVGVFLNVRPRITVQRDVDMEIKLELSNVVPGQTAFGQFIFDKRRTHTKVIVKNGQTIVLSGILTDTDSRITRGIPLLQDIPFIGELFRSHEDQKKSTELLAFITPIVVDNPSENDDNFNKAAREHLKDLARPLKEQAKDRHKIREFILTPKGEFLPGLPTDDQPNPEDVEGSHSGDRMNDEAPIDVDELNPES